MRSLWWRLLDNPLAQRLRFVWRVLRHGWNWLASFNRSLGPILLIVGLVVAGSVAGFSRDHRDTAIKAAVAMSVYFLFEGAYRAWQEERAVANEVVGRIRELQHDRYGDLYRQCGVTKGALIASDHIRRGAVGKREPQQINDLSQEVDSWIERTGRELDSAGIDNASFLADAGDYGSGVHGGDDVIEIKDAMLRRQLERLDRHVERLRTIHDRLTHARDASVRTLYGDSE